MMNLRKSGSKFLMLALTLLVAAAVGILIAPMRAEASETVTVGDYTYTITDGTAVLSKYNGTSSSVTVPTSMTYNGVTYKIRTIGENAFEGNAYIKTLVIPEEITSLGNSAFKNCTSLSSITINGDIGDCSSYSINTSSSSWYNYANYSVFYNAGANADSLTVTFGSSVTSVPQYLFATAASKSDGTYAHVTSVTLCGNVGNYAFYNCYDLKTITMKSSVGWVGVWTFGNCTSLTTINWGSNLNTIGDHAFYGNTSLTSVSLPSKVAYVYASAFELCTNLKTVVLPEATTYLDYGVFKNCTALSSITINGNIGDCSSYSISTSSSSWYNYANYSVFYNAGANADSLTVTFGSKVTYVPQYLFATAASQSDGTYAHVTSVKLSDSVTAVGSYAFYSCYDLTTFTMGSGLTSLGSWTFGYCTGLKTITWGSNLTSIGDRCFYYNTSLTSVSLPSKVAYVYAFAFELCTNLKTVVLPEATTYLDYGVFKNCTALSSITINGNIGDCSSYSINTSSSSWYNYANYSVFYNAGANADSFTVKFGSSVTRVPAYLFATGSSASDGYYAHITSVSLASKATEIGDYAFYHCYDLKTVTLNCNGLTIGGNSFGDVTATVYYPTPNSSWTSDLRTNYGGTLTWKSKFMSASKMAFSSVANATNGVKLSWSKVSAATGYKIYRKTGSGSYSLLKTITSNSTVTYTDTTVSSGTSYTYYIQAYTSSVNSSYTTKSIKHLGKCSVSYVCNTMDGLKAAWNKVTGASGYYVYRRNSDGTYSTTPTATVTSGSTTNWTDTSTLTGGKSYTYKVVAYYKNSSGAITLGAGATTKTCMYLKGGAVSSVANTSTGLKVTWSKVAGANGYQVYRKVSGGDYSLVKTVSGGSTLNWTDTSASDGKTYTYKVSPIYTNTSGQVTKGGAKTTKTCVRLTAPSISSLTNSASKTMLVKWGKKSGVTGYQIQYSTSSTFASGNKTITVTGASSVSKTIASLTKNKTYYVRIRTYKTVSGTSYYSVWSAKKSVKITK